MNKLAFTVTGFLFSAGVAFAQSPTVTPPTSKATPAVSGCESKAVGKNGKALSGAAKSSFLKKCNAQSLDGATSRCAAKAVSKTGKPLTGAAKSSFVKKCEASV